MEQKKERGVEKEAKEEEGGERSLKARRRSSTAEAAASTSRRRRRALSCPGLDLVWGARALLSSVSPETWANFEG